MQLKHIHFLYNLLFLSCFSSVVSQNISATIVDKSNKEPIAYASILYGTNKGVVSNDEGSFNITIDQDIYTIKDSLRISSVGYKTKSIAIHSKIKDTVFLTPEPVSLSSVYLSNKQYTPEEIIEHVANNMSKNYPETANRSRFFMRESMNQEYKKLKLVYKKSSIKELTENLIDSMLNTVPKKTNYHIETLADYYVIPNETQQKLAVLKTSKLYDKKETASFQSFQKKFMEVFNNNIKKDSYLKIKSGFFGTKVQADSIIKNAQKQSKERTEKQKLAIRKKYFNSRKGKLKKTLSYSFYQDDSKINVINKANKYRFTLTGVIDYNYELAYVITFVPKRSEDIKGTLYINTEDFAILRIEYENANPVYNKMFNMLGVNVNHVGFKGTAVYSKNSLNAYSLKYISHENKASFKVDRPLKIIEKNKHVKGRRKQNELKLQMQINLVDIEKREIVLFDVNSISPQDFKNLKENKNVDIKYFTKYNAEFWNGYNIIEPNQAIKDFEAID